MQLSALESYSEKDEARRATDALLSVLERTYDAEELPMRRARVLVRRLQACTGGGRVEKRDVVQKLADEVRELCEREVCGLPLLRARASADDMCSRLQDVGADAALRPFAPQYLALSHVFLAFHSHASQAPTPTLNDSVASSARAAITILRNATDSELPLSPSATVAAAPQAKRTSPAMSRTAAPAPVASPPKPEPPTASRPRRTTRAAATPARTRTLASSTRRGAAAAAPAPPPAVQVTPPRKARGRVELKESVSMRTPVKAPEAGRLLLDDVERVFALLGASASHFQRFSLFAYAPER